MIKTRVKIYLTRLLICAVCAGALGSCSAPAPNHSQPETAAAETKKTPAAEKEETAMTETEAIIAAETEPTSAEAEQTAAEAAEPTAAAEPENTEQEECRMTLFGIPLGQWTLVYSENYAYKDILDIRAFAKLLSQLSGQTVSAADKQPETGHSVLLGRSSPLTPRTDDLSYIVRWDGENLHIGGNSFWADCRALYNELIYGALGADYALNPPENPPEDVTLADRDVSDPSHSRAYSISAWCTSGDAFDTEELVRQAAEAGFSKVNISGASDVKLCRDLMKWCAIYDLEILWSGAGVSASNMTRQSWEEQKYILTAPHVWGIYLCDEPSSSQFESLAESVEKFGEYTDKVAFINLFPTYASAKQLGNPTYQAHVDEFFRTVPVTWASVDHYPLNSSGLNGDYMTNLEIVAAACQKYRVPFSVYLQSVSFVSWKRTPSERDLEWQLWCIRSFGAAEAIYFTYMTPYSTAEDFKDALIDHNRERTDRWYAAQRVNGEFAALDGAFARYPTWLGAFTLGADQTSSSRLDYMRFDGQYDFSAVIPEISSENLLLFGCFTNAEGKYAFSVVNCEELLKASRTASARIKTNAPVTLWQNGASSRLEPDADGYVSVELACGEGVFCEIGN